MFWKLGSLDGGATSTIRSGPGLALQGVSESLLQMTELFDQFITHLKTKLFCHLLHVSQAF